MVTFTTTIFVHVRIFLGILALMLLVGKFDRTLFMLFIGWIPQLDHIRHGFGVNSGGSEQHGNSAYRNYQ